MCCGRRVLFKITLRKLNTCVAAHRTIYGAAHHPQQAYHTIPPRPGGLTGTPAASQGERWWWVPSSIDTSYFQEYLLAVDKNMGTHVKSE